MSKDTTAAIEPKPIESKVNMNAPSKVKLDADTYMMRLYDFIPVNAQLIDHVRRLDGFNVSTVPCYNLRNAIFKTQVW